MLKLQQFDQTKEKNLEGEEETMLVNLLLHTKDVCKIIISYLTV